MIVASTADQGQRLRLIEVITCLVLEANLSRRFGVLLGNALDARILEQNGLVRLGPGPVRRPKRRVRSQHNAPCQAELVQLVLVDVRMRFNLAKVKPNNIGQITDLHKLERLANIFVEKKKRSVQLHLVIGRF